ncbi:HyaD/HybD family hydrogenase maturation endopeptidase [Geobacter hydrogenophilus]|uniref:Membrane protein n=1 Tax=Geobacter hydrogenophilus TaxID=40983 RepID=A0A9W6FZT1_9BACT|nr:HyaD/HybD family hydrogenase maturation endopeptidase [Geobacter hydrogenophilus]MBT0893481.1 HyaD/HybD family hydrogenase maturation endopeptidase [Geobacter hydrogenophilus]GLI37824.1 membrane protein [Geobacter hydrogenophilus]
MSILVLGIGNLIMTDDGVGVRVVQRLMDGYRFPGGVTVMDGGTLGLDLLPYLDGVERLLLVDAVETGGPPGTVVRLAGEEIPVAFRTKLSPHQMGLQDLLAVAEFQGSRPAEMVLWGVQPESVELGMELTPAVAAQTDHLVEKVLAELAAWGVTPEPAG